VCREAQLRRDAVCAYGIAARSDGKLSAHFNVRIVGYDRWVPGGEAVGVSVVGTAFRRCAVERTVVVEFLAGICVVDVDVVLGHVVDAVFDGPLEAELVRCRGKSSAMGSA
jgi:hypothetical protein